MKSLYLALWSIKQNRLEHILIIIAVSVFCFFALGIHNVARTSERQVEFFSNLTYKTFYFAPPYINPDEYDSEILGRFYQFEESHDWVIGHSDIGNGQIYAGDNLEYEFQTSFLDDLTIQNFRFPLADGAWLSDYEGSYIPCVIGGRNASQYKVGDIVKATTISNNAIPQIDYSIGFAHEQNRKLYSMSAIEIVGILEEPVFSLGLWGGLLGSYINGGQAGRVSVLIDDMSGYDLFAFAPMTSFDDVFQAKQSKMMVYCDQLITPEQTEELGTAMADNYASIDDAVQSEIMHRKQTIGIILPFVIFCGIVAIVSMIAMGALATLSNMEAYKIYSIVGASKLQSVRITVAYSFVLSAITVLFYEIVSFVILHISWPSALEQVKTAYYPTPQNNLWLTLITVLPLLIVSFSIPIVVARKQSIMGSYKAK
jgi:hypothetical protein